VFCQAFVGIADSNADQFMDEFLNLCDFPCTSFNGRDPIMGWSIRKRLMKSKCYTFWCVADLYHFIYWAKCRLVRV